MPATTRPTPGSPPTSPPASTAAIPSAPRPTPIRPRRRSTPSRARPMSWARRPITSRPATRQTDATFGYGDQMGLAVFDGQVYPIWAGNFNQSSDATGTVIAYPLNIWYTADGHRRRAADHQQHDGADPARRGGQRRRSASPSPLTGRSRPPRSCPGMSRSSSTTPPTAAAYGPAHGDRASPRSPAAGPVRVSANPVHGRLQPTPAGANPATYDYTGTYSYSDRSGQRQPDWPSARRSRAISAQRRAPHGRPRWTRTPTARPTRTR